MLWNLFKHLKNKAPIYIDVMDEQESKIPQTYVILEEDVFDENRASGDGTSLLRVSSFNIRIHSRTAKKAREIVGDYRKVLIENNMSFQQYGPTYDPGTSYYSILITGKIAYGNKTT